MSDNKKQTSYNPKITKEDKELLGDKRGNVETDDGDDQQLRNRTKKVDFEGKDLDVPGRTLPEDGNKKQLKDEENQLYSEND
ncbi:hypothetical protein M0G43_12685 [Subsaxibacter sp. CAU 1640]|uniref:hypothetical protein n=1 Tax=Subsaxibacter sp. CAU 1640 TaxID=2933271 RepID=UPI002002C377|nr:hypothetical protein [Subsaxibacter sp. CAU 1640]MCK7591435.1 hypothetical protein [Subsaxibacter sp. CAU 1640]